MPLFTRSRRTDGQTAAARPTTDLEGRTLQIGREVLHAARDHASGLLSTRFWSDQLMNWAMKDPAFKVQLFRFVDVFPMLGTPERVHEYLVDYLSQPGVKLPTGFDLGLRVGGLAKGIMARTIAGRIEAMARNFIAGADAASALPKLQAVWRSGMAFSVDLLGEACVSDAEARAYQARYLDLIKTLPDQVAQWPAHPLLESDHVGHVPRTNVSIKISSLAARTDPIDFEGSLGTLVEALRPILETASRRGVLVNFDIEQASLKELTLALFERCCQQIDFSAGLALQSYLRSGDDDAARVIQWARRSGRQVTVRLIKGAYWDYEVVHAEQMGWPVPVWTEKRQTDACFERMADQFVRAMPRKPDEGGVKLALGSHNVRSIAHVLALLEHHGFPPSAVDFQMLYGMADGLKAALVDRELRVRQYVPVGQLVPGMAYLVRRLLENTSNQSWLRAGFAEGVPEDELLASPVGQASQAGNVAQASQPDKERTAEGLDAGLESLAHGSRHQLGAAVEGLGDGQPFMTEPHRDYSQKDQREQFALAVGQARVPGVKVEATAEDAQKAVTRASTAFPGWRDRDPLERAAMLIKAAAIMRQRRDELAGIMVREGGKPWREADADVAEGIDFCEFYARQAVGLFQPQRLGRFVGELNHQWHQPRGVAAVISPWNFPLAICAGMTTAALVTGNTAIVKPSTQTPGIARAMCEILWSAGFPADVLQFLPGRGGQVGSALVRDPRVALIAFTGSKEVGLDILRAAGEVPAGQGFVKKVVCEMGGKNAIIIDDSADLDEAVLGVRQSAFGYCGQKCSACSRAIVLDGVYDTFLRRLIQSTRTLVIGDPAEPGTDLGPVIDEGAAGKIREYIEIGKTEGKLELACEPPPGLDQRVGKPYVGPHIFSGIQSNHRLAREEIFGPVLSVMRAKTFDEGLEVANGVEYKLTGGVFSRSPAHLEAARQRFRVGNLYLNRGITGALVGRQPFGGFGLSGTGTKAGGTEYLLHFVESRCCCENTMRHGFAPGLD